MSEQAPRASQGLGAQARGGGHPGLENREDGPPEVRAHWAAEHGGGAGRDGAVRPGPERAVEGERERRWVAGLRVGQRQALGNREKHPGWQGAERDQ